MPGKIKRLEESVVNRIAAGEIIVHPANAIKEMIENSIDANSTLIEVLVKDGGLKLLQVTDNGDGIVQDDLHLLCERFATSKIAKFDDLNLIQTYGFRGEAMASISHIGRLSVVSKTHDAPLAYKAFYVGGKLVNSKFKLDNSEPKPVAGKEGTQITVEDLFYNTPSRLRTMRLKNDEWAKILDVVGRYAVHSEGVGFTCKKFGELFAAISTRQQALLQERIRTVFGTSVASELIEFNCEGTDYGVGGISGAVSGFNYNNKRKLPPVFFINNRLVSCDPLRRALNSVLQVFLPKGNYPFIYLSLRIKPENLDVNVHPTKKEVRFLHEDEIIEWICGHVHDVLASKNSSRTFKQSTLKRENNPAEIDETVQTVKKYRQENKLVRVDHSQPKINAFVKKDFQLVLRDAAFETEEVNESEKEEPSGRDETNDFYEENLESHFSQLTLSHDSQSLQFELPETESTGRERQVVNLDSIAELKQETKDSVDRALTNVFNNLVYVGIVDPSKRLCCFQYDVKLFLCDYGAVLTDFYYQLGLTHFSNFGEYVMDTPLGLHKLLAPLYEQNDTLSDVEEVIGRIMDMSAMFLEYFQLDFSGKSLSKLPILLQNVTPPLAKLPHFIYRLGTRVDYSDEKQCLHDILYQLALLYIPGRIENGSDPKSQQARDQDNHVLESFVFPALRKYFIAPEKLALEVVQVADLPGLYKVFERC